MRHYQKKRNNPYILPHNLYMSVLYIIRDYERLKSEREYILTASPLPPDGQPRGMSISNPTEDKAMKLIAVSSQIDVVDKALRTVPKEYRKGVMDNILYESWYPIDAGVRTYQYWKQRFIYYVAKNMKLI